MTKGNVSIIFQFRPNAILPQKSIFVIWTYTNIDKRNTYQASLYEKCPYLELFWSIFSRIRAEYEKIRTRITPNTDTFYAVHFISRNQVRYKIWDEKYGMGCEKELSDFQSLFPKNQFFVFPSIAKYLSNILHVYAKIGGYVQGFSQLFICWVRGT